MRSISAGESSRNYSGKPGPRGEKERMETLLSGKKEKEALLEGVEKKQRVPCLDSDLDCLREKKYTISCLKESQESREKKRISPLPFLIRGEE